MFLCIRMDLALNFLQTLICHQIKETYLWVKKPTVCKQITDVKLKLLYNNA